jgi:hypothetical protein
MEYQSHRSENVDERGQTVLTAQPVVSEAVVPGPVPAPVVVVTDPAIGSETVRTSRTSGFTPAAAVAAIAAILLLLLGGITAARAGIDGSLDVPVVTVAGYTATAVLGLIELGFGIVLLAAALTRSRQAILFLAIAGGVAALVAVFEPTIGGGWLALERGYAVIAAIVMGAIVLAALLPTMQRSSVVRRTTDVT